MSRFWFGHRDGDSLDASCAATDELAAQECAVLGGVAGERVERRGGVWFLGAREVFHFAVCGVKGGGGEGVGGTIRRLFDCV